MEELKNLIERIGMAVGDVDTRIEFAARNTIEKIDKNNNMQQTIIQQNILLIRQNTINQLLQIKTMVASGAIDKSEAWILSNNVLDCAEVSLNKINSKLPKGIYEMDERLRKGYERPQRKDKSNETGLNT